MSENIQPPNVNEPLVAPSAARFIPSQLSPTDYSKLKRLLRSRKFWTTTSALAITGYLYLSGDLSADSFANATALIAGIYVGSIAIEDGLRGLINIWTDI